MGVFFRFGDVQLFQAVLGNNFSQRIGNLGGLEGGRAGPVASGINLAAGKARQAFVVLGHGYKNKFSSFFWRKIGRYRQQKTGSAGERCLRES